MNKCTCNHYEEECCEICLPHPESDELLNAEYQELQTIKNFCRKQIDICDKRQNDIKKLISE
jgi:hypothetical protein